MIRGKMAVMFDPSKLMPGAAPKDLTEIIRAKKERERLENGGELDAGSEAGSSSVSPPVSPSNTNANTNTEPEEVKQDAENLRHFSKPKIVGRKSKKIPVIHQDVGQRKAMVAMELSKTEEMYSLMLSVFIEAFVRPIRSSPASFGATPAQVTSLCMGIERINAYATRFARMPMLGTNPSKVFNDTFPEMSSTYKQYITEDMPAILSTLHLLRNNPRMKSHIRTVQANKQINVLDNFLMPIQRLMVYELLLRKYLQTIGSGSEEAELLNQCIEQLQAVNADIGTQSQQLEASAQVLAVQMTLSQYGPLVSLWNQDRRLVSQQLLVKSKLNEIGLKKTQKKDKNLKTYGENTRLCYLFNDLLLWATEAPEAAYKGHVSLAEINVRAGDVGEDMPAIIITHNDDVPDPLMLSPSPNNVTMSGSGRYDDLPPLEPRTPVKQGLDMHLETEEDSSRTPQPAPVSPTPRKPVATPKKKKAKKNKHIDEGWVLVFVDTKDRDKWLSDILSAQSDMTGLSSESQLYMPLEIRGDGPKTCCVVM